MFHLRPIILKVSIYELSAKLNLTLNIVMFTVAVGKFAHPLINVPKAQKFKGYSGMEKCGRWVYISPSRYSLVS